MNFDRSYVIAADKSLNKWSGVANGKEDQGSVDCALCQKVIEVNGALDCRFCPVYHYAARPHRINCNGIGYDAWCDYLKKSEHYKLYRRLNVFDFKSKKLAENVCAGLITVRSRLIDALHVTDTYAVKIDEEKIEPAVIANLQDKVKIEEPGTGEPNWINRHNRHKWIHVDEALPVEGKLCIVYYLYGLDPIAQTTIGELTFASYQQKKWRRVATHKHIFPFYWMYWDER